MIFSIKKAYEKTQGTDQENAQVPLSSSASLVLFFLGAVIENTKGICVHVYHYSRTVL